MFWAVRDSFSCVCFPCLWSYTLKAENLLAPYWLPWAASNGFDMDNAVVFVTKGGGDLIKAGDSQLKKEGGRVKWRRGEVKWRGLNLTKAVGCQGQLKWLCVICLPLTLSSGKLRYWHIAGLNMSLTLEGWNKIHTLDVCLYKWFIIEFSRAQLRV